MSNSDCIFCSIVTGKIPCIRIWQDDLVLAFLDIGPVSHCIGRIAQAVVSAVGAEAYNVLCNNGIAAGQLVEHVHFHIIPRNSGDGVFDRWPAYKYKEGRAEEIATKIREKL